MSPIYRKIYTSKFHHLKISVFYTSINHAFLFSINNNRYQYNRIYEYFVVLFHFGDSPASEFYVPTFRNTLSSVLICRPMKIEQCSETSAQRTQTPGSHPKERTQHSQRGESLNSSMKFYPHLSHEINAKESLH